MPEFSYIGKGQLLLAPYDGTAGYRKIGNVHELSLAASEDVKELSDYTQGGGGLANSIRRISKVEAKVNLRDFVAANIAMAVFGATTAIASGAVTDEQHTGYHDEYIVIDNNVTPSSIVVKDVTGTTTYTLDTDYTVESDGLIKILSTGTIASGDTLKISYSYVAHNAIEALVNSGKEWVARFVGLNEAQSDKPVVVSIHRLKFGPAGNLSFIGDDFGALELSGDALKDSAITGTGISQYFKVQQVEV